MVIPQPKQSDGLVVVKKVRPRLVDPALYLPSSTALVCIIDIRDISRVITDDTSLFELMQRHYIGEKFIDLIRAVLNGIRPRLLDA